MKEHIYTIPVTEAFGVAGECPLCFCQRKLEEDALEYEIGAAMMEPDHRVLTNQSGFCGRHHEKLYNMQKNRLSLGLVLDTHLEAQHQQLAKAYRKSGDALTRESMEGMVSGVKGRLSGKKPVADSLSSELIGMLDKLLSDCSVCSRVSNTMHQFADTVLWLFFKEPEFRETLESGKGFCLPHFKLMLDVSEQTLSAKKKALWLRSLLPLQLENLERVQTDVHWFTLMFDHRNKDADWKQSRDALQRAVEKLSGPLDLV